MTPAQLQSEITNDPAGLGYAGKTSQQIVDLINAARESITISVVVPKATVLQVIGLGPFRAAALSEPKRTGWLESLANIRSLEIGIVPSDAGVSALLTSAVADGVLTADEKATLDALGTRTGSRAEQLWGAGTVVTLNDVARVR